MSCIDLNDYKNHKKLETVLKDLKDSVKLIDSFIIKAEENLRKYIPVRDSINHLKAQKLIIEIHIRKITNTLDENPLPNKNK